jgi:acid phosphatase
MIRSVLHNLLRFLYTVIILLGITAPLFSIGSSESATCPPAADSARPAILHSATESGVLRFYALGDTGRGDSGQAAVAEAMAGFHTGFSADLALLLGDNFYPRGVRSPEDPQWQSKFEGMYDPARLDLPFYAILGNHDYRRNASAQIEYSRKNPQSRWKMPERYYCFSRRLADGTRIDFFAIDTNAIEEDSIQMRWLEKALASSAARWKIVFAHHVLYSYGHYGNDRRLIDTLEEIFLVGGVDLYLSGHEHQLQILESISGVSYMASGAGARSRKVGCGERTVYAAGVSGFLAFEISKNRLTTFVVLADGRIAFTYAIVK